MLTGPPPKFHETRDILRSITEECQRTTTIETKTETTTPSRPPACKGAAMTTTGGPMGLGRTPADGDSHIGWWAALLDFAAGLVTFALMGLQQQLPVGGCC